MPAIPYQNFRKLRVKRGASPVPALVGVCCAVLVAGGAWWWFFIRRPDPAADAMKYLQASKTQDYATMYKYSMVNTTQFPTEAAYEQQHRAAVAMVPAAMLKQVEDSLTYSLGKVTVNGDEATVPVTFGATVMSQQIHKTVQLHLHYSGSVWQVEPGQKPGLGMAQSPGRNGAVPAH